MKSADHHIIDRYFYQCLKKIENQLQSHIHFFAFRSICLLVAIPVDHYILSSQSNLTLFTIFLLSSLAINILQMTLNIYLLSAKLKNKRIILKIADDFKHCRQMHDQRLQKLQVQQIDEIESFEIEQSFGLKVSTQYYDYENLQKINDVSEEFKYLRQKNGQNNIKTQIEKQIFCYRFINNIIFQLCSLAVVVLGIIASTKTTITQAQHNILEIYIIFEVVFKPYIYFIIFVVASLPFIGFIAFIYCCCCKKQRKANLPEKVKANTQIISKCSECAICFMKYDLQQQVIVLQCSQMHVFHQNCIKGWTKVKASCPICRKDLSEN